MESEAAPGRPTQKQLADLFRGLDEEETLYGTLRSWRSSPFVWGQSDCLMSVMTHAWELAGVDPGAPWRGRYHDEAGAKALLHAAGGAVALLGGALEGCRFGRVRVPVRGDIIVARFGSDEVGGLWLGESAAFRLLRGVKELRAKSVEVAGAWH